MFNPINLRIVFFDFTKVNMSIKSENQACMKVFSVCVCFVEYRHGS